MARTASFKPGATDAAKRAGEAGGEAAQGPMQTELDGAEDDEALDSTTKRLELLSRLAAAESRAANAEARLAASAAAAAAAAAATREAANEEAMTAPMQPMRGWQVVAIGSPADCLLVDFLWPSDCHHVATPASPIAC